MGHATGHAGTFPRGWVALYSQGLAQTGRELCNSSGVVFPSFVCVTLFLAEKWYCKL